MTDKKTIESIPKLYYYTIQSVVDEEGLPIKTSFPSFGRDLEDEFDVDSLIQYILQSFYESNVEYQDVSKWPLTVKLYKTLRDKEPKEVQVELSYAPSFRVIPKSIVQTKESMEAKKLESKRTRKTKE